MTYHFEHARMATTAIAAALALASTPLLAQDVGDPPPVTDTPSAPAVPMADPLAPEPVAAETAAVPAEAAPTAARPKAASTVRRPASAARPAARPTTRSEPATPVAEEAVAAPPAIADAAPAEVSPGAMPVAESEPAVEPVSTSAAIDMDEALPIAGGAALGLMLLGGAAAVRRRQRRKREDADEAAKLAFIDASHDRATEAPGPGFARPAGPRHDPAPASTLANAPVTKLPEGFDLSRFGRHVQAAYRGPTPDNPSLSLKYRLRKAGFLDQQERRAAELKAANRTTEPAMIPARGNWESRPDADFLFRRSSGKPAARPVLQDR